MQRPNEENQEVVYGEIDKLLKEISCKEKESKRSVIEGVEDEYLNQQLERLQEEIRLKDEKRKKEMEEEESKFEKNKEEKLKVSKEEDFQIIKGEKEDLKIKIKKEKEPISSEKCLFNVCETKRQKGRKANNASKNN